MEAAGTAAAGTADMDRVPTGTAFTEEVVIKVTTMAMLREDMVSA